MLPLLVAGTGYNRPYCVRGATFAMEYLAFPRGNAPTGPTGLQLETAGRHRRLLRPSLPLTPGSEANVKPQALRPTYLVSEYERPAAIDVRHGPSYRRQLVPGGLEVP